MLKDVSKQMTLAFIGGGGGSGLIILVGLVILAGLSVLLLVGGVAFAFSKRPKLSVVAFGFSLAFAFYPFSMYVDYTRWAEIHQSRKRDFEVVVRISPNAEYWVSVDGIPNSDELILLDGMITFHVALSDSRTIRGRCSQFQSKRINGDFGSFAFGGIDIPTADRSALMASMPEPPKGAGYFFQTEAYTIWFRRVTPEFEWLTCIRRIK